MGNLMQGSFADIGLDEELDIPDLEELQNAKTAPVPARVSPKISAPIPLVTPGGFSAPPMPLKPALQMLEEANKLFDFTGTGLTPTQQVYIVAYLTHGTKMQACKASGIDPRQVTRWEKESTEFAEVYKEALCMVADALEEEAMRRAMAGSDKLMALLLKANKPDKYAERRVQNVDGKIDVEVKSWADLAKQASPIIEVEAEVVEEGGEVSDVEQKE